MTTGDSTTQVLGRGTIRLVGKHLEKGRMEIPLSDALYSPSFHTNLVSYASMLKKGGTWCQRTNCIRDPNDRAVVNVHLWDQFNLWVFDEPGEAIPQQAKPGARSIYAYARRVSNTRQMLETSSSIVRLKDLTTALAKRSSKCTT